MNVKKLLLISAMLISSGGLLLFGNFNVGYNSDSIVHADSTQMTDSTPDGTIITPMRVVKAPDPADKTDTPTVDPKQHTDIPVTNFYDNSIYHQQPIYVDGQLANPMGTNPYIGNIQLSSNQGQISENDFITPPEPDEVINYGYFNRGTAYMVGWSKDNTKTYIHQVNSQGHVITTTEIPGPKSSSFNPNWTMNSGLLKFSWQNGRLQIDFTSNDLYDSTSAAPLEYLTSIPAKFVDANGHELAPEQMVSGYSGTFVNVNYPTIPGYRLIRVPFMNNNHQFLINNTTATTPGDWTFEQTDLYTTVARKIIDDQNTQEMYMIFDYSKIPGFGSDEKKQSDTVTVKATPGGFIAANFSMGMAFAYSTAAMPTPVGNPLKFVYEPIKSYNLTINYLEQGTNKVLADPYKASGAGTYEITSPVISGYTADKTDVKGVLNGDTVVNVYYSKKNVPPVNNTSITINYINEADNKNLKTDSITGKVGDSYHADGKYQLNVITVDGVTYELDKSKMPTNISGTLADSNSPVNYYYKKQAVPDKKVSVPIQYIDEDSDQIIKTDSFPGTSGQPYQIPDRYQLNTITVNGNTYTLDRKKLPSNTTGTFGLSNAPVKYYYTKKDNPVPPVDKSASLIVNYIDESNNSLIKAETIHGQIGDPYAADGKYQLATLNFNGQTYELDTTRLPKNIKGVFSGKNDSVNYYYKKHVQPNPQPKPDPQPKPQPQPNPQPQPTPEPDGTVKPGKIAKKGMAVYSLKKIYLYDNPTFKKSDRKSGYVQKPRVFRPMFVVTDYARSNAGRLRYKVRDVNHLSKTDGWTGYITTNYEYVRPVYYQIKHSTLTVINPRGVNEYTKVNLTGKVKNYKQGTVLKVKGFVTHNLTTRYLLSNGHYITGNRKLVKMGIYKQPKQLIVKKHINRYKTVNFTQRNGHFKKGQKLTIKRYTFSHEGSITQSGTKRYVVKDGYITANNKFVKVVKY